MVRLNINCQKHHLCHRHYQQLIASRDLDNRNKSENDWEANNESNILIDNGVKDAETLVQKI
jgi:hypothetical protein